MRSALAVVALVCACADDGGPRLDSVSPTAASVGATVTITGTRLCGKTGDCTTAAGQVQLGLSPPLVRAVIVSYADTAAQIAIPTVTPVGRTSIVVTVNDTASNALPFEVLP